MPNRPSLLPKDESLDAENGAHADEQKREFSVGRYFKCLSYYYAYSRRLIY